MKKNKFTYLAAVLVIIAYSCTEKDIEIQPTRLTAQEYYSQENEAQANLELSYTYLKVRTGPWGNSHVFWGSVPSDDAYAGGQDDGDQPTYQAADLYTVSPNDPGANLMTHWRINFQGVKACNTVLSNVKPETDLAKNIVAQALFLKAYYYFIMCRVFGGLPIINPAKQGEVPQLYVKRASYDSTLLYVENLLKEAISYKLSSGAYALSQRKAMTDPEHGKPTITAAYALLGKVCLYQKKYDKVIEYLSLVDQNAFYQLESNFADLFKVENEYGKESIFEIDYSKQVGANNTYLGNGEIQLFGPRIQGGGSIILDGIIQTGWGFNQPTKNLVDAFISQNDNVRLNATVISNDTLQARRNRYLISLGNKIDTLVWENSKDGYWDAKHLPLVQNVGSTWQTFENNTIVLRLADVYLMLAEAYNRIGNDAKAQEYLNRVRARVGLPNVTATGDALFEAIKLERRLELALEGERYFDLLRWGDAEKYLGPLGWIEGKPGKNTNGWFAIPQQEIDKTLGESRLEQNPGY